jgi:hypothetical protein
VDGPLVHRRRFARLGAVTAYVDESIHLTGGGCYLLAAVVVPPGRADDVRAALRIGLPRRLARYHWRDESPSSRGAMAARVGGLGLCAVVVVAAPVDPRNLERARRRALTRLLWELAGRGVVRVVLETRGRGDARDRKTVAYAQRSGWAPVTLRYEFGDPRAECLLWLPDIVAGAVGPAMAESDTRYRDLVGPVDVVETG